MRLLPLLLLAACSEYDLKQNDPNNDGAEGEGEGETSGLEPNIEVDPSLSLLSACGSLASADLDVRSVGEGPLTVSEITVDWDDNGTVEATPAATLPVTLAPGETLPVALTWAPGESTSFGGVLRVSSDDPDTPRASVDLSGALSEGGAPLISVEVPDCYTVMLGDEVALVAEITDEESSDDLSVTWESDRDGTLQTGAADADYTSTLAAALSAGTHTVTVTVTDACGQSASATVQITVTDPSTVYSGGEPDGLDFDGDGYLWVADYGSDRVYQLDPESLGILKRVSLPYRGADGLSWMGDTMLVSFYATNNVVAIDPCDGSELSSWDAPGSGVSDVSWDGTNLWLTDYNSDQIFRVDPDTGARLDVSASPLASPNGITWDGAQFWMTSNAPGSPALVRMDADFTILERYDFRGDDPRGIAWDGTDIWYSNGELGWIGRLTP